MNSKKLLKRIFPLIALLLLAPWPVAYAYDSGTAGQETVQVTAAEASAAPSAAVFGKAIGSVTPGDLFYINATESVADIDATLYLTNAGELVRNYRYLILKVGVYVQGDDGEWQKISGNNGETIPDTLITMRNGQVSFTLAGYAKYKLTIDGGSFYAFTGNAEGGSLSPQFYLEVN